MADELRMTLMEHLTELRSRLLRCVIAVVVLGAVSLFFSRHIYGILMKPVLDALPPDGRSLIYTSGIEELNVLMKVGLYCGLFLTTPVILWEIWRFIAPGLLPHERRYTSPFVFFGSLAFVVGVLFGYYVLLPTMFQFLLQGGDAAPLASRVEAAKTREKESLRFLRLGDLARAGELAHEASQRLSEGGDGQVLLNEGAAPERPAEMGSRLDALGRLVDASHDGLGPDTAPILRQAMEKRMLALEALDKGLVKRSGELSDEAAVLLSGATGSHAAEFGTVWALERHIALASGRLQAESWTRPMLTMSEQLTLVLTLLLAMGVIFELPLIMALLATLGLVKASWLMKYQRHAFVVCLIIAAIVTPTGDAINLSLMAGPMVLCYELGVLAAWLIEKRKGKNSQAITPAS